MGSLNLTGEEPRRAIATIEMSESGEYVVPHVLGLKYYNKPPVFNWVLALFTNSTGSVSEFILRLPSLVFLMIWAFVHYRVSRRFLSENLSLLSAFFMLTSADLYFYFLSNGAEIDIFYSLVVYLQAVSIFLFYKKQKWWSLFLFSWIFCAIGFLTKGFPSLVFQLLTMIALAVQARSIRIMFKPQQWVGFLLFLLISGSYFLFYHQKNDATVFISNLVNESMKKSAIGEESSGKLTSVLTYPLVLVRLLAPWCIVFLFLFKKKKIGWFENPWIKFSILFVAFNIVVYWISGVQKIRYVYMFIPFAMNIIVYLFAKYQEENPRWLQLILKSGMVLFILAFAGLVCLPFFTEVNVVAVIICAIAFAYLFYLYVKKSESRVWLFVTGIILIRIAFSWVLIPQKAGDAFDYKPWMKELSRVAGGNEVFFQHPTDTLKLDNVVDKLAGRQKKDSILMPSFLYHQIPYYYYRFSGKVLKLNQVLIPGTLYISYKSNLKINDIQRLYSFYDGKANDSVILFRAKNQRVISSFYCKNRYLCAPN